MSWLCWLLEEIDLANVAAAGLAAFGGGWAAFRAAQVKENKKQKISERSKLVQCFYDLHFALRNVSYYHTAITKIHKGEHCNNTPDSALQMLNFQFDIKEVCFICNKNPKLYENICQVATDWNQLSAVGHTRNYEAITEHVFTICMKLMATMENLDEYLIEYYGQKSIIVGDVNKNLDAVLDILPSLKQWKLTGDKALESDPIVVAYKGWRVEI